jgi:hypothetical protein
MARWFTQYELFGFPVELAEVGDCELRVCFVGGEWQWLIRCEGQDVAEGAARTCLGAKQQAENAARRLQARFLQVVAKAA